MGIGAIYKELTFGGDQSGDYGLYISGAGAFNAPQRDVEMVTIPGRNGAFALDHGRFENIEVTYPAGVFGTDDNDFASKVADIRAWLCSKKGYVQLTDEYNPSEYRLAVYKSGLDVSLAELKAGEFDLVFECMPQRFLSSGKNAQPIASSGNTLNNPTLFNSRPMLEVDGYGKIGINGEEVEIASDLLGRTIILESFSATGVGGTSKVFRATPNYSQMNSGDEARIIPGGDVRVEVKGSSLTVLNWSQTGDFISDVTTLGIGVKFAISAYFEDAFAYNYGTTKTASATASVRYKPTSNPNTYVTETISISVSITAAGRIDVTVTAQNQTARMRISIPEIDGFSTKSALGSPLYIDLDIGEAYKIENGAIISINNSVYIPPELPELIPGVNTITFDNTVTQLKIVPRWWTV